MQSDTIKESTIFVRNNQDMDGVFVFFFFCFLHLVHHISDASSKFVPFFNESYGEINLTNYTELCNWNLILKNKMQIMFLKWFFFQLRSGKNKCSFGMAWRVFQIAIWSNQKRKQEYSFNLHESTTRM